MTIVVTDRCMVLSELGMWSSAEVSVGIGKIRITVVSHSW